MFLDVQLISLPYAPRNSPSTGRRDSVQVSYYKVTHRGSADPLYPCGPWEDAEAAIVHFNAEYGPKVGKTFTTLPTGRACADYVLIEQERRGDEQVWSLHDVKEIALFVR